MTARNFNYTKQNGVLMKASKRFTKQNGVVKQILSGWTKQNGVIEQVYSSVPIPQFAEFVLLDTTGAGSYDIFSVSDTRMVYYEKRTVDGVLHTDSYIWDNYMSGGTPVIISPQCFASYGFNYASGVAANQSILSSSPGVQYAAGNELYLSNPSAGSTNKTGNGTAYIKRANMSYVDFDITYGSNSDTLKMIEFTNSTSTTTNVYTSYYVRLGKGLTLSNGRGVIPAQKTNMSTTSDNCTTIYIYFLDYNNGTLSRSTAVTISRSTSTTTSTLSSSNSNLISSPVYTTNGQDCYFSVTWTTRSSVWPIDPVTYMCKYDTTTSTASNVAIPGCKCIIGTYNNYIYAIGVSSDPDVFVTVEQYDSSFQLIKSKNVPMPTGATVPTKPFNTGLRTLDKTAASNSRYMTISDGKYILRFDMDLF